MQCLYSCQREVFNREIHLYVYLSDTCYHIHLIAKALPCEHYKPLTMRPNRFMGSWLLLFAYSNARLLCLSCDSCKLHVAMETVQANLKVTNKAQFECFKGAVSRFYHDFERIKNTPRSYITQQKWFYFGKHHSTNNNNPLGSEDG